MTQGDRRASTGADMSCFRTRLAQTSSTDIGFLSIDRCDLTPVIMKNKVDDFNSKVTKGGNKIRIRGRNAGEINRGEKSLWKEEMIGWPLKREKTWGVQLTLVWLMVRRAWCGRFYSSTPHDQYTGSTDNCHKDGSNGCDGPIIRMRGNRYFLMKCKPGIWCEREELEP